MKPGDKVVTPRGTGFVAYMSVLGTGLISVNLDGGLCVPMAKSEVQVVS